MDKAARGIGFLVLLGASGCTLLFGPDSAADRDAAAEEADAAAEESDADIQGDGGMQVADGAASDARPPFDCGTLRQLAEGSGSMKFEVLTDPIHAGNPLKFEFILEGGEHIGIELVRQDGSGTVRAEKISDPCALQSDERQAAHCGAEEAGFYCAFLFTREAGTSNYTYLDAVEIEVLESGESRTCTQVLEEEPACDQPGWGEVDESTCACDGGGA